MKLSLIVMLIVTSLFSQAEVVDPVHHESNNPVGISCVIMFALIGLLIAGLGYKFFAGKKAKTRDENSKSGINS